MKKLFNRLFGNGGSGSIRRHANDPKRYRTLRLIGRGTFGNVYEAKDRVTGNMVAIKKIEIGEDSNAEHELKINLELSHSNVVRLLGHFEEKRKNHADPPVIDLCLVLEYTKTSLRNFIDDYRNKDEPMPQQLIRLLTFQMFRALHYLHSLSIVHRDVKPSNILLNKKTYVLKISDFGSAKRIVPGEPRSAGICSAPYRAPELELMNEDYNEKIDIWAAGCVIAECCTGEILFRRVKGVTQYDLIRALLGDPTPEDIAEFQPLLRPHPHAARAQSTFDARFAKFHPPSPPTVISLIKRTLAYRPSQRPSAIEACADIYYDPLRRGATDYDELLYNFTDAELEKVDAKIVERVVPPRFRNPAITRKLNEDQARVKEAASSLDSSMKPSQEAPSQTGAQAEGRQGDSLFVRHPPENPSQKSSESGATGQSDDKSE